MVLPSCRLLAVNVSSKTWAAGLVACETSVTLGLRQFFVIVLRERRTRKAGADEPTERDGRHHIEHFEWHGVSLPIFLKVPDYCLVHPGNPHHCVPRTCLSNFKKSKRDIRTGRPTVQVGMIGGRRS